MQTWTTRETASNPQGNQLSGGANGHYAPPAQPGVIRIGDITIDLDGKAVIRNGREVRLSPTEYGLLSALAIHAGRVIDQRTLLHSVWGLGHGHKRNYLRTYVHQLRAKLEPDPRDPEVIVTVGARGYRLGAPAVLAHTPGA
jgi:two-component system, OmpR family, KDP operon response regulator KdpE